MCGAELDQVQTDSISDGAAGAGKSDAGPEYESDAKREKDEAEVRDVFRATMWERRSLFAVWLLAASAVILVVLAALVLRYPSSTSLAFFPTSTMIPDTETPSPTWTPSPASATPTSSPSPTVAQLPTDTPRPPRTHTAVEGDTLFGLSLRYGITADSIAEANGLPPQSGIQVQQQLLIPWPTATPPLIPVAIEIAGETIIADPTDCRRHRIEVGDTLFAIALRNRVDLRLLTAVNRLTDQTILQPGDSICIPKVNRGGVLPPTPGPSPTPSMTGPAPGPQLLLPPSNSVVDPPQGPVVLQWEAVKDLAEDEWYMVEIVDLTDVDSHPRRDFTRQTSFLVPNSWRPQVPEVHLFRWRVQIVRVTGQRSDGSPVYTFGGNSSRVDHFSWLGQLPTPTPRSTPEG